MIRWTILKINKIKSIAHDQPATRRQMKMMLPMPRYF